MGLNKKNIYEGFSKINGDHPYRKAVPDGYVDYEARVRRGGRLFYFNFGLAREMGLIHASHPDKLNPILEKAVLDAFAIEIINEYDLHHGIETPARDIKPGKYMATRYLQVQHPSKKGYTSGDGRSIWNGYFKQGRTLWDLSSCGTGTTCLSPAVANEQRLFQTGDKNASYGSGRSDLLDGISGAVMSEVMHFNNIPTERTLALIAYPDDTSINVRASKNLLRPAHVFAYVKQGDYQRLKGVVDYYIDRQIKNRAWPRVEGEKRRYQEMLNRVGEYFARAAARFESEYIFCWMDWDGDNILMDGAIIDYGSVRQFGLYHHEYRYDDVERMSTSIPEQKSKARYIVQTFAQAMDFLVSGEKKPIGEFRNSKAMERFDETFSRTKDELLLDKLGFDEKQVVALMKDGKTITLLHEFRKVVSYFEKAKSERGPYEIYDGVTWDAAYCVRDIMRELPARYLASDELLDAETFMDILRSNYAYEGDLVLTRGRRVRIRLFQLLYRELLARASTVLGKGSKTLLKGMSKRSALINRYDRVTGDSIICVAHEMRRAWNGGRGRKGVEELYRMLMEFVDRQVLRPEYFKKSGRRVAPVEEKRTKQVLHSILSIVKDYREGI